MNGTSILAMAALVVACMVSAFSLFTENPEREIIGTPLRRYRKPVLYVFTGLTLVFGGWQILKADKESRDAEKKHAAEREADEKQISSLKSSVEHGNAMLERILVTLNQPQVVSTGASGQHAVRLSWQPNETIGVVGYNIYRADEATGKISRLNSVPLSTPSYVDEHVTPGSIYSYFATAVNSKGMESRRSNEIKATIPQ